MGRQRFEARSASNYCYPKVRFWAHTLLLAWRDRHKKSSIKLSRLERTAMSVLFICPRPISLVSVTNDERANIFPLNVMSDLHDRYFAFALTAQKAPAEFLRGVRFFALSATPIEQGSIAFDLAANHNTLTIIWDELPFETKPSRTLGIPVPIFSQRSREMEIESVHSVGSHALFIARTYATALVRLAEGEHPRVC
jgi:flavin reductase (DIM6/NTAB) family NADH-FMN oxidoreductase RutF